MALMQTVSKATIVGGPHDFTSLSGTSGITVFKWGGATGTDLTGVGTIAGNASFYINPCQVCHIPHKAADAAMAGAPLWNHALSTNTYVTYSSGNSARFKALGLTASLGSSTACLSCHDGSVAINQAYGKTTFNANGGTSTTGWYVPAWAVETNASKDGPFTSTGTSNSVGTVAVSGRTDLSHMHPIGVSYSDALAVDPTLQPLPTPGTVFAQMLKGPKQTVECASCHDIHGVIGVSGIQSHSVIVDLNYGKLCETCHQQ